MKTILKLIGYIITFLLMAAGLVAIVLYIMGLGNGNTTGNIITTMPPTVTATIDPNGNTTISDTQQNGTNSVTVGTPTPVPTPIPDPTPVPTPTPEPTPTPPPPATPLGDGKFKSDTKLWIDLEAVWAAETLDNERAKVTITANLHSYSLYAQETDKALEFTVDGETQSMDLEKIYIHDNVESVTELGQATFIVDAPAGQISLIPVKVVWNFGGSYSGQSLPNITVEEDIEIAR